MLGGMLLVTSAATQTLPPPPSATNSPSATPPSTTTPATTPAKPIPKPKPKIAKPKPAPAAPLSLTAPPPASNQPRPPAGVGNNPFPPPPVSQAAPQPPRPGQPALTAKQLHLVERVSTYLSNIRTLIGEFKQIGPDGRRTEGSFYLMKVGRVRFDYNPPNPTELIADGKSVAVRDRNLASQDLYPISQTPLRFLLADRIDLLRDADLLAVYGDDVFVTVVIEEKQIMRGTYKLMLMFSAKDYQLKKWVVTDPQGLDTTIAVYNLDPNTKPDPELFKIDYTRYIR